MELKKHIIKKGYLKNDPRNWTIHDIKGISPSLMAASPNKKTNSHQGIFKVWVDVSDSQKLTSTQSKSTKDISQNTKTMGTQQRLFPKNSQTSTFSVGDFLAKAFRLLAKGKDLKIQEAHSFLTFAESRGLKDPHIFSLKMSEDSSPMIMDIRSWLSLNPWQNWGILSNGKCLTAKISESHKTGNECSLLDILQKQVPQKYFLSQDKIQRILKKESYTGEILSVEQ